jgi:hypothetical protein
VKRAHGGAERRRVADDGLVDVRVEDVGHHLEDRAVRGGAAGRVDRLYVDTHPFGVELHRHHLRFDDGADVPRDVVGAEMESPYA